MICLTPPPDPLPEFKEGEKRQKSSFATAESEQALAENGLAP